MSIPAGNLKFPAGNYLSGLTERLGIKLNDYLAAELRFRFTFRFTFGLKLDSDSDSHSNLIQMF